jgi:hypothetical protein
MKLELDEYSASGEMIKCTVENNNGEYTFWWSPETGATPSSGRDSRQHTDLTIKERLEAYSRARIAYYLIYDLNQKI